MGKDVDELVKISEQIERLKNRLEVISSRSKFS
jgi:hypothetical protein